MPAPNRILTSATLVLLTVIWGTTWAAIRVGLRGIPPFTGVALRFTIAGLLLVLAAGLMGVKLGGSARERWLWLANALLQFCLSYGVVYWAEQWVPSGLASVLFSTFPLFVAVAAHFWLPGERLGRLTGLGIVMAFGGIVVIFSEDLSQLGSHRIRFAAAVLLISPLASAIGQVILKRWGKGIHPLSLTAVPMMITGVVMAGVARLVEQDLPLSFDWLSTSALLYLAVCGSALTFTLYFWLLAHISASRLSLIAFVIPIVALAVGAVFLNEPITPQTLAGSALVLAGVAVAVQTRRGGGVIGARFSDGGDGMGVNVPRRL